MKKKNLLLNPLQLDETLPMPDQKSRDLFRLTRDFFEHKGEFSLKAEKNSLAMPTDWYQFIKESGIFAELLTPAGYGGPDARWDQYRITAMSDLLGFYGFNYQYTYQVSILGVAPIWTSKNEKQKRELAQQLKEGHVFAFGMSERAHGADLYSNECIITPIGEGKYIANGEKYYIGNSSRAAKISVFGKNSKTNEYAFWVVDSRDRHCKYCGDIETPALGEGQIGLFDMIEYPITEDDILLQGKDAFAMGLAAVNIGKTQTSATLASTAAHMIYETVQHSHHRYLYGKRVTDMPHIRRMLLEAWARTVMSRLYSYRTQDYFRQASKTGDRRFLCFNPIQKSRSAAEGVRAALLIADIMAARSTEMDTFSEGALRGIDYPVRLEGTAHVNMSQIVKYMNNYFKNNVDLPEVPDGKMIKDDSSAVFDQGFGKAKEVLFADYRRSFEGCNLPNVKIFLEQAEILRRFNEQCPMTKEQENNPDFALSIAETFAVVAYGQLVMEKAKIEGIEDMVIDQMFSYLVRDINTNAQRQICEHAGHFGKGQREALSSMILDPNIDLDREDTILEDYIFSLDGVYPTVCQSIN